MAVSGLIVNKHKDSLDITPVKYSQSNLFNMIAPFLPSNDQIRMMNPKPSQAINYNKKMYVKILFLDQKAYWIKDNSFFVADVVDGNVLEDSARKVDTMGMDKVELDKMSFIVDKLTEGLSNDSGNSGKS